jgi:short-subunit dehydrogenase
MKIQGCIPLITGANRGIGEALVHELLKRGAAKVYACARNPALLETLVASDPKRIIPVRLDVTKPEQAEAAAAMAIDINLLINNAGVTHNGVTLLHNDAITNLREEIEVNLIGILNMFRAFMNVLGHNQGAIANVLSGVAIQHNPMCATYSCSKAAALSMTQGMRTLLRQRNTLVSAVIVGAVDTRMSKDIPSTVVKATPQSVATAIVDGLERGDEDIDADAGSIATRARVGRDPKKAERHNDHRLPPLPPLKPLMRIPDEQKKSNSET